MESITPTIVCVLDDDYTIQYVNQGFQDYFQVTPDDARGTKFSEFFTQKGQNTFEEHFQNVTSDNPTQTVEQKVSSADGRQRWLEWTLTRDRSSEARSRYFVEGQDITPRRKSEQLQQAQENIEAVKDQREVEHAKRTDAEDRLETIFNAEMNYMALLNMDGEFVKINQAALELEGASREEIIGSPFWEAPSWMDAERIRDKFEQACEDGPVQFETEHIHARSSEARYILASLQMIDSGDERQYVLAEGTDITERKRIQRERERLVQILEYTPDYVGTATPDGTAIFLNEPFRQLAGIASNEDPAQYEIADFHSDQALQRIEDEALPTARKQGSWSGETTVIDTNGCEISVSQVLLAHYDETGDVVYFSTIMRDISELKKAQRRLQFALDAAQAGVWTWDPETGEQTWNKNVYDLYGLESSVDPSMEQILNKINPEDRDRHRKIEAEALEASEDYTVEYRIDRNGETRWIKTWAQVHDRSKKTGHPVVGIEMDITEQKNFKQKLQANQDRLQLALEGADAGIFEWNLQTGEEYWDENLCRLYGLDPENQPNTYEEFLQLVHPDDRDQIKTTPEDLQDHPDYHHEFRVISGPQTRWLQVRGRVFYDSAGNPQKVVGVSRDITQRKQRERELQRSRDLLQHTEQLASTGGWEIDVETEDVRWTEGTYEIHDLDPDSDFDPTVDAGIDFFHPEDQDTIKRAVQECMENGESYDVECRLITKEDRLRWVRTAGEAIDDEGKIHSIRGAIQDITEHKQAEQALRDSEQKFRELAENIEEVFWIAEPDMQEPIYQSPAVEDIWGRSREDLYGEPDTWMKALHPEDRPRVKQALDDRVSGDYDIEYRIVRPDGEVRWIHDQAFPVTEEGEVVRIVGVAEDITERKRLQQELEHQALYDQLTGLPNRTLFDDRVKMAVNRAKRHDEWPFAVVFLDLDQFKELNDTYGHSFGDELLKQIAQRLQETLRSEDTIARFGGDEFLVLLEDVQGKDDMNASVHRILSVFEDSFHIQDRTVHITASIGVTWARSDDDHVEDLIREADTAMFRAKEDSAKHVQFFSPDLRDEHEERRELVDELQTAFETDQFEIHYQPIVDCSDETPIGLEALVRWRHPNRGLLLPGAFLPHALETNLLPDIEWQVIQQVISFITQHKSWFETNRLQYVSVNLSPQYFLEATAVQRIVDLLNDTGLNPRWLRVELTEQAAVEKQHITQDNLQKMKRAGLLLAIDEFGTGDSSLRHLQTLPIDYLKIDRSLVSGGLAPEEGHEILQTAIQLADNLNIQSIAVGVETLDQFNRVQSLGCDYAQGFYFDQALRPDTVVKRISEG